MKEERQPEHCPETAQSHFLQKMNELTSPLIEVKILPIIFCFHCPETEKGQNRSCEVNPVISICTKLWIVPAATAQYIPFDTKRLWNHCLHVIFHLFTHKLHWSYKSHRFFESNSTTRGRNPSITWGATGGNTLHYCLFLQITFKRTQNMHRHAALEHETRLGDSMEYVIFL